MKRASRVAGSQTRLVAALSALMLAAGAHAQQGAGPVFSEQVGVVSVDVVVLDKEGAPVTSLAATDFQLSEEGVPQHITSFEALTFLEGAPAKSIDTVVSSNARPERPTPSFVVILDDVHLTPPGVKLAKAQLKQLLASVTAGEVTILPTSGALSWTATLPHERADLDGYIDGIKSLEVQDLSPGRISDWEAMTIHNNADPKTLGVVARRWFENGLIPDRSVRRDVADSQRELDISPGLPLIRAKATEMYRQNAKRAQTSLATVERLVQSLASQRGRKTVFVMSEGFTYDPTLVEFRGVLRAARQANAVLHFIDARGAGGYAAPGNDAEFGQPVQERDRATVEQNFSRDSEGAKSVALDTGGSVIQGTNNLASGMEKVLNESRSYYLLGYVSTNKKADGKFRKLQVTVAEPGLTVRARRGYYAPGDTERTKAATNDPTQLDPNVRRALDSPITNAGITLRLASYVVGRTSGAETTALLVAEVGLGNVSFTADKDRQKAALDTYLVITPQAGGLPIKIQKRADLSLPPDALAAFKKSGLPLIREAELGPGTYQARLLVRDESGSSLGTVRHTFTIPDAGAFRTTTPILTDVVQKVPTGELPVPVAHRNFAGGSRLVYAFDVLGAGSARGAGGGPSTVSFAAVVRRPDGGVLAEAPERALAPGPDGSLSHHLAVSLQGAAAGEYQIHCTLTDRATGQKLEWREPFVVDAPS